MMGDEEDSEGSEVGGEAGGSGGGGGGKKRKEGSGGIEGSEKKAKGDSAQARVKAALASLTDAVKGVRPGSKTGLFATEAAGWLAQALSTILKTDQPMAIFESGSTMEDKTRSIVVAATTVAKGSTTDASPASSSSSQPPAPSGSLAGSEPMQDAMASPARAPPPPPPPATAVPRTMARETSRNRGVREAAAELRMITDHSKCLSITTRVEKVLQRPEASLGARATGC